MQMNGRVWATTRENTTISHLLPTSTLSNSSLHSIEAASTISRQPCDRRARRPIWLQNIISCRSFKISCRSNARSFVVEVWLLNIRTVFWQRRKLRVRDGESQYDQLSYVLTTFEIFVKHFSESLDPMLNSSHDAPIKQLQRFLVSAFFNVIERVVPVIMAGEHPSGLEKNVDFWSRRILILNRNLPVYARSALFRQNGAYGYTHRYRWVSRVLQVPYDSRNVSKSCKRRTYLKVTPTEIGPRYRSIPSVLYQNSQQNSVKVLEITPNRPQFPLWTPSSLCITTM